MTNDKIADLFTCIRNSLSAKHSDLTVSFSNMKYKILTLLQINGFITKLDVFGDSVSKKVIKITLKYDSNGTPVISKIKRISKSSRRIYCKKSSIPKSLNGFGLVLLSTSLGILTGKEARIKNVGGELIGEVW